MGRILRSIAAGLLAVSALAVVGVSRAAPPPQKRDYLSDEEADKIREAYQPADRIKLYMEFADDRLKKFDYELNRTVPERHRDEILNSLLNAYAGCVDDAADQIDVAQERQADIHAALKLMRDKEKDFLATLEKYQKNGPSLDVYKDTLEDAIEGTKDAIADTETALKTSPEAPVRRKQ